MNARIGTTIAFLGVALVGSTTARAATILVNGGFETNGGVNTSTFTGWTVLNQALGSGSWFVQTGTTSPSLFATTVPPPPQGSFSAMVAQGGPGAHLLYQDFSVPVGVTSATLTFQRYVNNIAGVFVNGTQGLDYTGTANQQDRVDIITTSANAFSVASADVLRNIFQTNPGNPSISGYSLVTSDLTSFLQGRAGQTLRLRFGEVDNQGNYLLGIDNVILDVITTGPAIPEPTSAVVLAMGLMAIPVCLGVQRRMSRDKSPQAN